MQKQNLGKNILLAFLSSLIFLLIADLVLRFIMPPASKITESGWAVEENSECRKVVEDTFGNRVEIKAKYFNYGFKRWGDPDTKKIKMFIIGDSYTQMDLVSNGQEWYAYLEKEFKNLELFVYGEAGYGSFQEYMVLDDYIDKIKPDLIILQFCENDLGNNLYLLDLQNYPYNNHEYRPYLEGERIVYKQALPLSSLRNRSFIANMILEIYDWVLWDITKKNLLAYWKNKEIKLNNSSKNEKEKNRQLERRAFKVTDKIMGMIKERAAGIPVYFLDASVFKSSRVEKMCKANNFIYIPGITECVIPGKKNRRLRIVNDGHWNKLGNKLVGERPVEYFKEVGISKIQDPAAEINLN